MGKFGVIVIERCTDERWTHSVWSNLDEAEDQRRALEAAMPGAVIEICDWSSCLKCGCSIGHYPNCPEGICFIS